jgi:DNA-binding CsgD family transcriptional regulator
MEAMVSELARALQSADSLLAIGALTIRALEREGYRDVALVVMDGSGLPAVWVGTGDPVRARRYLSAGHHADPMLAELRRRRATIACGDGVWLAPLLGSGELFGTLRATSSRHGELALVASLISVRLGSLGLDHASQALTARQHEVAWLVARGCTNGEIGKMLSISSSAVKKHVSRALSILGLTNRTELAAHAGRWTSPTCESTFPGVVVVQRAA